ncbi:hypothetical protein Vretifemale_738, partial [Volvox reticuliferus]
VTVAGRGGGGGGGGGGGDFGRNAASVSFNEDDGCDDDDDHDDLPSWVPVPEVRMLDIEDLAPLPLPRSSGDTSSSRGAAATATATAAAVTAEQAVVDTESVPGSALVPDAGAIRHQKGADRTVQANSRQDVGGLCPVLTAAAGADVEGAAIPDLPVGSPYGIGANPDAGFGGNADGTEAVAGGKLFTVDRWVVEGLCDPLRRNDFGGDVMGNGGDDGSGGCGGGEGVVHCKPASFAVHEVSGKLATAAVGHEAVAAVAAASTVAAAPQAVAAPSVLERQLRGPGGGCGGIARPDQPDPITDEGSEGEYGGEGVGRTPKRRRTAAAWRASTSNSPQSLCHQHHQRSLRMSPAGGGGGGGNLQSSPGGTGGSRRAQQLTHSPCSLRTPSGTLSGGGSPAGRLANRLNPLPLSPARTLRLASPPASSSPDPGGSSGGGVAAAAAPVSRMATAMLVDAPPGWNAGGDGGGWGSSPVPFPSPCVETAWKRYLRHEQEQLPPPPQRHRPSPQQHQRPTPKQQQDPPC